MSSCTIYSQATGEILRTLNLPDNLMACQCQSGESFLIGEVRIESQYISQGELLDKPQFPITTDKVTITANSNDVISISNIPTDTTLITRDPLGGYTSEILSGTKSFSATQTGTFILTFQKFPYLPKEVYINGI